MKTQLEKGELFAVYKQHIRGFNRKSTNFLEFICTKLNLNK